MLRSCRLLLLMAANLAAVLAWPYLPDAWGRDKTAPPAKTIGPEAVWRFPDRDREVKFINRWQNCKNNEEIVAVMRQGGASPQAIAFSRTIRFDGYLDSFQKMGTVDLASMAYPTRANTNQAYLLVNGRPRLISAEDHLDRIDIRQDPLYPALAGEFPKIMLWKGGADFHTMERLPGGGQRFIFAYFLLNGCHACEVGGSALVAYDFDEQGRFLGTKLLRLSRMRPR